MFNENSFTNPEGSSFHWNNTSAYRLSCHEMYRLFHSTLPSKEIGISEKFHFVWSGNVKTFDYLFKQFLHYDVIKRNNIWTVENTMKNRWNSIYSSPPLKWIYWNLITHFDSCSGRTHSDKVSEVQETLKRPKRKAWVASSLHSLFVLLGKFTKAHKLTYCITFIFYGRKVLCYLGCWQIQSDAVRSFYTLKETNTK